MDFINSTFDKQTSSKWVTNVKFNPLQRVSQKHALGLDPWVGTGFGNEDTRKQRDKAWKRIPINATYFSGIVMCQTGDGPVTV